ncbi:MAG TPA: hypothetical protein VFB14_23920 [Bryobacteraceae bacterium]|jgi:hypothetical protein|nr:hypothetical protein [Bryobacteraceae bacterium]
MTFELEPIVLAFSDGRRDTLSPDLTRRIWESVRRGDYASPQEFMDRALDAFFQAEDEKLLRTPPARET